MEIKVTEYVKNVDCRQFSDSIHNSGLENIGLLTWNNAVRQIEAESLITADQQQEARDWLAGFGAWSDDEIKGWQDNEVEALLLQFIAGDIQEMEMFATYEEYQEAAEAGQVSSRLFKTGDDEWFYYVGD